MHYYVIPQHINQKTITFSDEQMHHMRKVMRLEVDDQVSVFDEKGNVYTVEMKKISKDSCYGAITDMVTHDLLNKRKITLIQSFPSSFSKLDLVVEKCTEIGVDYFVFYKSKRSELVVPPSADKISRWKRIIISAAEQSRRYNLPEIMVLNDINELDFDQFDTKIVLYEKNENKESKPLGKNIAYVIGPEGGLEESEVKVFESNGFESISPFENILRTETAAIAYAAYIAAS